MVNMRAVPTSAQQGGQGLIVQADPSERSDGFRANPSGRRSCAAIAKKIAQRISEFFKRIASCFPSWKKGPTEAALKKAANKAASTINDGLVTNDFTKVYQGLKRLHNAEQKFPENGKRVSTRVKAAIAAASDNPAKNLREAASDNPAKNLREAASDNPAKNLREAAKNLREFAEGRDDLVNQHSDSKPLFYRVLKGLEKIGLVRNSYIESFNTVDNEIKESLKFILRSNLHHEVCSRITEKSDNLKSSQPSDHLSIEKAVDQLIKLGHEGGTLDEAIGSIVGKIKEGKDPFDKYILHLYYKYGDCKNKEFDQEKLLKESIREGCNEAKYYQTVLNEKKYEQAIGCSKVEYYQTALNEEKYKQAIDGPKISRQSREELYNELYSDLYIEPIALWELADKGYVEAQYKIATGYPLSVKGIGRDKKLQLIKQLAEIGHLPSKQKLDDLLTLGPKW